MSMGGEGEDDDAQEGDAYELSPEDDLEADVRSAYEQAQEGAEAEDNGTPAREFSRDERGRFAPSAERTETAQPATAETPPEQAAQPPPEQAQADRPPPGWSQEAKEAWAALPPAVRAAVAQREVEINNGFRELQHWKSVRPFAELAAASGTTLPEALERYVNIENVLRQDPVRGFATIAENMGLSAHDLAQAFTAIAGTTQQAPPGDQLPADPVLGAIAPVMQQLTQRQQQLEAYVAHQQAMERQSRLQITEAAIDAFAKENALFAEVEGEVVRLLQTGYVERTGDPRRDLQVAYDLACRLNPAAHERLVNERLAAERARKQEQVARARQASRSLSGTAPTATPPRRPAGKTDATDADDLEEVVRAAYREHMT